MKPVLHVSGMFGAQRHNIALIVPLALHPTNRNEVICFDLSADPETLFELTTEQLGELLFSRTEDLPAGFERPGLKTVHVNRCPVLVTARMADPATAERLGIRGERCRQHLRLLREHRARGERAFVERMQAIYAGRQFETITDPDRMLYSGGFFSAHDKQVMEQVRSSSAETLASARFDFEDGRLPEMLFRYRARNFPASLSPEEREQWEDYRYQRLTEPAAGASLCMDEYQALIEQRLAGGELDAAQRRLMEELQEYGDALLA
jgi:exodeoxyribonuclease-1